MTGTGQVPSTRHTESVDVSAVEPAVLAGRADRLRALSHPGLARVLEVRVSGATASVVTETPDDQAATPWGDLGRVLETVGGTAMALAALHAAGLVHGEVATAPLRTHADRSTVLGGLGAALAAGPDVTAEDDVRALATMLRDHLGEPLPATVTALTDTLDPPAGREVPSAAESARIALAMAARATGLHDTDVLAVPPVPVPAVSPADTTDDDTDRLRVRNRMLGVGALVVLLGLVVLKACGGPGGARVQVPDGIGHTSGAVVAALHTVGLRARLVTRAGNAPAGTVVAERPAVGTREKAGSTVTLVVSGGPDG